MGGLGPANPQECAGDSPKSTGTFLISHSWASVGLRRHSQPRTAGRRPPWKSAAAPNARKPSGFEPGFKAPGPRPGRNGPEMTPRVPTGGVRRGGALLASCLLGCLQSVYLGSVTVLSPTQQEAHGAWGHRPQGTRARHPGRDLPLTPVHCLLTTLVLLRWFCMAHSDRLSETCEYKAHLRDTVGLVQTTTIRQISQ